MSKSRIVVIGGSGFIGTRLVGNLLEEGHDVRIADIRRSEAYPHRYEWCDVRDLDSVSKALEGYDVVYNLAAEHRDDVKPLELYESVNVDGARNVCKAAEAAGIDRLIFTSSVAVYGFSDRELDESAPLNAFNEYGRTKARAEEVYREWRERSSRRGLVIVRPTVVFGESNRGNFYNLARTIAGKHFVMIGAGRNKKSIAYVGNVAAFLAFSLRMGAGEHLFNYVDKPDFDMNSLVELIRRETGASGGVKVRIPYLVGLLAGYGFDLLATVTGKKLAASSVRVRKFCESTVFGAPRVSRSGFIPPFQVEAAVRQTIAAEFGTGAADEGEFVVAHDR